MNSTENTETVKISVISNATLTALLLTMVSLIIRLIIWKTTGLIRFSEYEFYLIAADRIIAGHHQVLLDGNMLFAISHIAAAFHRAFGSYEMFYVLNSLLGGLSGLLVFRLIIKTTGNRRAGIIALVILLFYTEFQAFSAVFYTPVIMIFLVALLLNLFHEFVNRHSPVATVIAGVLLTAVFMSTFLFKPELKYLPYFLIFTAIFLFVKGKQQSSVRLALLIPFLIIGGIAVTSPAVITRPEGNVISNSFIFFGHTDYGGDGGEGAFIYDVNRQRYETALEAYLAEREIREPSANDYNDLQRQEIKKFIFTKPHRWVALQVRKFFGTFGIVPETTSFRILYSGLLSGRPWLSAIAIAAPVALIVVLSIATVRPVSLMRTFGNGATGAIMLTILIYYLIATIFYGQYQERYRMPVFVLFLIPVLGYSLATINARQLLNRTSLIVRSIILIIFLSAWTLQSFRTLNNTGRLSNILSTEANS